MNVNANIFSKCFFFSEQNGKGNISGLKQDGSYKRTKRFSCSKDGYKNLKIFSLLYRKDIPKACFFRTLSLKRIGISRRHFVYSMKMKKEESSRDEGIVNKTDSTTHGGNKVLPITQEAPLSSSAERNDQCDNTITKDQVKGDRKKPMSRMKELLRWAAASAKTDKGGKFYGRKVILFQLLYLFSISFGFVFIYFYIFFMLFYFCCMIKISFSILCFRYVNTMLGR